MRHALAAVCLARVVHSMSIASRTDVALCAFPCFQSSVMSNTGCALDDRPCICANKEAVWMVFLVCAQSDCPETDEQIREYEEAVVGDCTASTSTMQTTTANMMPSSAPPSSEVSFAGPGDTQAMPSPMPVSASSSSLSWMRQITATMPDLVPLPLSSTSTLTQTSTTEVSPQPNTTSDGARVTSSTSHCSTTSTQTSAMGGPERPEQAPAQIQTWMIGMLVAIVFALLFIQGVAWFLWKRRRSRRMQQSNVDKPQLHSECLPRAMIQEPRSKVAWTRDRRSERKYLAEKPANEPPAHELAG